MAFTNKIMSKKDTTEHTSISISKNLAKTLDKIQGDNKDRFGSRAELAKFIINEFLGRNFGYNKKK